ncbi:DUF4352 domain-containing protein [Ferroplasma sp.]|uniref:DUF4352 domain-containing protein n=1 Tax=Ferroplasma sp. TaxID=2591003 RepID=UPI00263A1272|nr:DUF4352 domain-containing protein [Ferroplasma sp.]
MVKKKWIALIIVVVLIIAAIAIIGSSIPTKNQVNVTVSKTIDDHADEVLAGHSGNTAYIFNITIKYTGSGSLSTYPTNFYIVTSNGTVAADTSGFFSNVTKPLNSVTLSSGQSVSGQIYDSFSNNVKISSIYYSYDGQHYAAPSVPAVSEWISYIGDINVNTNDSNITAICTPGPFISSAYNSGTILTFNISLSNDAFSSSAEVKSLTINATSLNYSYTPKLPLTIGAGDDAYITLEMTMPNESNYYSNININISAATN